MTDCSISQDFVPGEIITVTTQYGHRLRRVYASAQLTLPPEVNEDQQDKVYVELDGLVLILEVYPKEKPSQRSVLVRFISGEVVGWTWIMATDVVVIHERMGKS